MVVDLKRKELMDCLKRILVCGRDVNSTKAANQARSPITSWTGGI